MASWKSALRALSFYLTRDMQKRILAHPLLPFGLWRNNSMMCGILFSRI
jgi:hypothetical protein